jgi:hypothetical protein
MQCDWSYGRRRLRCIYQGNEAVLPRGDGFARSGKLPCALKQIKYRRVSICFRLMRELQHQAFYMHVYIHICIEYMCACAYGDEIRSIIHIQYVCVCVCIYTYICVYIYIYIYIYIKHVTRGDIL